MVKLPLSYFLKWVNTFGRGLLQYYTNKLKLAKPTIHFVGFPVQKLKYFLPL